MGKILVFYHSNTGNVAAMAKLVVEGASAVEGTEVRLRNVDDVARLAYVPNISGALVGRALFRRSLELRAALDIARPEPEPIAEFI